MFNNWFKKSRKKEEYVEVSASKNVEDEIEESLWQIKEEYDLPTEEIINVVHSKRKNLEHMHEMLSRKQKYE